VNFNVPVPPLNWDTSFNSPVLAEWVNDRGFELMRSSSNNITISSVEISGNSVIVTADSDSPATGVIVEHALANQGVQMTQASKSVRWGQLRGSIRGQHVRATQTELCRVVRNVHSVADAPPQVTAFSCNARGSSVPLISGSKSHFMDDGLVMICSR